MAKLHGLTMGLDVCATFHMGHWTSRIAIADGKACGPSRPSLFDGSRGKRGSDARLHDNFVSRASEVAPPNWTPNRLRASPLDCVTSVAQNKFEATGIHDDIWIRPLFSRSNAANLGVLGFRHDSQRILLLRTGLTVANL